MTEHKRRSGLMGSDRMVGNFVPKESYSDNSNETTTSKQPQKHSKERKNIKIPADMFKRMEAIKHVSGLTYNYEVLQLLMDSYVMSQPESFRKHVKELMDI